MRRNIKKRIRSRWLLYVLWRNTSLCCSLWNSFVQYLLVNLSHFNESRATLHIRKSEGLEELSRILRVVLHLVSYGRGSVWVCWTRRFTCLLSPRAVPREGNSVHLCAGAVWKTRGGKVGSKSPRMVHTQIEPRKFGEARARSCEGNSGWRQALFIHAGWGVTNSKSYTESSHFQKYWIVL